MCAFGPGLLVMIAMVMMDMVMMTMVMVLVMVIIVSVFTGPGVDQSGLDRSGFSPVRSEDFSDWNRTSPDSVWTGPGLHCRVRFILAEIGLGMG